MSEDKNFYKTWKLPKKLKKEYQTSKEATSKIDPEKLKDFEELGKSVFDCFEELTGKKINRIIMLGNLSHYFDEGFEPDEMRLYILDRMKAEYFRLNPEMFTISNLFPIKDQDRMNYAWDHLAHFQAIILKTSLQEKVHDAVVIALNCGHSIGREDWKEYSCCLDCIRLGNEIVIMENPYAAMKFTEDPHSREIASHFLREPDESLENYARRTYEKRAEILKKYGKKVPSLETLLYHMGFAKFSDAG